MRRLVGERVLSQLISPAADFLFCWCAAVPRTDATAAARDAAASRVSVIPVAVGTAVCRTAVALLLKLLWLIVALLPLLRLLVGI